MEGRADMNKILIVTLADPIGKQYRDELRRFFNDAITIDSFAFDASNIEFIHDYDLILISSYDLVYEIKDYINPNAKIIKIIKNISPNGLRNIEKIPYGSNALVVNVGPKTASESINMIYSHGRTDLNLYPYYPGIKEYVDTEIVITQGEPDIFQNHEKQIIDIYNTVIDIQIYWDIIIYFGLPGDKYGKRVAEMSIINGNYNEGFSYIMSEKIIQDNVINSLFENLNEGVIIFDENEIIINSSSIVYKLVGCSKESLIERSVFDILPLDRHSLDNNDEILLTINNSALICNIVKNIILGNRSIGLIILKKYDDMQIKMYNHTKQLLNSGYRAKYYLKDIVGSSEAILNAKDKCIKMAASDSTVLILGESGTGKEMFAHVIHENSFRRDKQFVAINCASIPDNLLESELFGYEEGTFTGAKKGGKKGIFEIANNGTLFLDEIAEIPLHLQNRLLRVLQEKEVTRIGGNNVIPIDIRVIAATNVDLKNQVKMGLFRKDLYYRLCVLPLIIPPLRERNNDILEIFDKFCSEYSYSMQLSDAVKKYFLKYEWEGNIRELRNCFEYLKYLGKRTIDIEDLPDVIKSDTILYNKERKLKDLTPIKLNVETEILKIIYCENSNNRKVGRKSISNKLSKIDIYMSEQEVRKKLIHLNELGFVYITNGRGGTKITNEGLEYLQKSVDENI